MIERIEQLDRDAEFQALSEQVAVVSPVAIELLAYEHLSSPVHEASRIAGVQLRVITELGSRLAWLERACVDPSLAPELRIALAGLLRGLCDDTQLLPVIDSRAAVLLEPALLLHELLADLRPWMPPMVLAVEPQAVLDLLRLGIPDYLHPLLRARFEALWALFHRLRQLPAARLTVIADPPAIDDERLLRLLDEPTLASAPIPPAPAWTTPSWASPWLGDGDSPLRELPVLAILDLTG
ncbi:MAG TPA: hypothetical protein VK034_29635 [Enhygromyxa sp.]|nr:hypothetical protein [Enhygromyxa sp.]